MRPKNEYNKYCQQLEINNQPHISKNYEQKCKINEIKVEKYNNVVKKYSETCLPAVLKQARFNVIIHILPPKHLNK